MHKLDDLLIKAARGHLNIAGWVFLVCSHASFCPRDKLGHCCVWTHWLGNAVRQTRSSRVSRKSN